MREAIGTNAPRKPAHRFGIAFTVALLAVLSFSDAFGFIMFPVFRLGLPDTAAVNTAVLLLGLGLLVVSYDLARSAMRDGPVPTTESEAEDRPDVESLQELEPVGTLKVRYAMGEIDDDEFEHRLRPLRDDAANLDRHTQEPQRLSEVGDRQTMIDQVENRQTVID
jgi:hypothetical protein